MQEHQITVKNLNINYKMMGQGLPAQAGKPLLILHGWGSNSDRWQKVAELLSVQFQVIIPDLPGFGKSQALETAWSLDNYVDWVNEFSQKIPDLQNEFYVLGHSFGGAVAAKFAIKYNQKVLKLFLVSAACIRTRTTLKRLLYGLSKVIKLFSFMPLYPQFRKAFYKFVIRRSDYLQVSESMKETYLKTISEDLSYKLFFIKVPTVIIFGDKDTSTPVEQAHFIKEKVANSNLTVIAGADHTLHIKIPEILAQKILAQLNSV